MVCSRVPISVSRATTSVPPFLGAPAAAAGDAEAETDEAAEAAAGLPLAAADTAEPAGATELLAAVEEAGAVSPPQAARIDQAAPAPAVKRRKDLRVRVCAICR
jgi:hypothetical protein